MRCRAFVLALVFVFVSTAALAGSPITRQEVLDAQKQWGDAIVAIGKAYQEHKDYKAVALKAVEDLYAYDLGTVLFKPTKASTHQYRPTKEQALSYFVGGVVPEDKGFAIQPWSKVRFDDRTIILHECDAIAQGNYYFTDAKTGKESKVEFTFGYVKDSRGNLRIFLHHSSLPYPGKSK